MQIYNKVVACFSGQGAQKVGMFRDLYDSCSRVREVFEVATEACGFDVAKMCFEGPEELLNQTIHTQPCVLACDIAAYYALSEKGIKADYVAGFSLGEYAALHVAGCISLRDTFRLIRLRAEAMQNAVPLGKGGMLAIITEDFKNIEELCQRVPGYVIIANYNSRSQIVVSGDDEGIDAIEKEMIKQEIRCVRLAVSAPFHCELMRPAMKRLTEEFEKITFSEPSIPIVMNYDGKSVVEIEEVKKRVLLQTISPVRWIDTIEYLESMKVDIYIECGPGNTLSKLIKKTVEKGATTFVNSDRTLGKTMLLFG